jgi:type VI secretion system protein ImpC
MQYDVSFGTLGKPARPVAPGQKFRLAVLGDFSGRANAGKLSTGAALGATRPVKIDVDNLDDVIARLKLTLNLDLAGDGQTVAVPIGSMDDFHPDQLAENLEFFGELMSLRRNLGAKAGFDRAAKQVLSWGGEAPLPAPPRQARGATIAKDCKLSDFARLTGRKPAAEAAEHSADDLVRRLVGPFVQPARDARQDQLTARVDEALSAAMRRVLHHPDFQAMEAVWRGVEFLVRRIETGARMEIILYDVSAEELAADLAATDTLEETGLYALLAEAPRLDANQGPFSAVLGLYGFELSPVHADLLGRVAKIAAAAGAPFVASIAPDPLATPIHDQHPLIKEAWAALQGLQEAAYLGLATPRFLLRMPYGRKSDPIDAFAFEEFTRQSGLSGMLWGHPALLAGLLLAETFKQQGAKMTPGSIAGIGDMPYYVYIDPDGDQTALPCTERLYSERQAVQVSSYRVMPVLSLRGRPEVRLGGFASLGGGTIAGFWAPVDIKAAPPPKPAAPEPQAPRLAMPDAAAPQEAAPEAAPGATDADLDALDALLAGLETPAANATVAPPEAAPAPAPAEPAPEQPAAQAPAEGGMDDLDALLASLSAEPPSPAPDATESDLDALLASLK